MPSGHKRLLFSTVFQGKGLKAPLGGLRVGRWISWGQNVAGKDWGFNVCGQKRITPNWSISTAPHLISPGAQQAFIKAAFVECSQRIGLAYVDMTKVTSHHLCWKCHPATNGYFLAPSSREKVWKPKAHSVDLSILMQMKAKEFDAVSPILLCFVPYILWDKLVEKQHTSWLVVPEHRTDWRPSATLLNGRQTASFIICVCAWPRVSQVVWCQSQLL